MTDQVSTRVVSAVAEEKGVDSTELPPLYDAIDPDALDALCNGEKGATMSRRPLEISFRYADRIVRISDGAVVVDSIDA